MTQKFIKIDKDTWINPDHIVKFIPRTSKVYLSNGERHKVTTCRGLIVLNDKCS